MELLEYLRLRRVPLALAFILGLVAIVAIGAYRDHSSYKATATLYIRPPENLIQSYTSDPDRYVNTQLGILTRSSAILRAPAKSVGLSTSKLRDAVSASHGTATDIATISVQLPQRTKAIEAVNGLADSFVSYLSKTSGQTKQQQTQIANQIKGISQRISTAQQQIDTATRQYRARNPGATVPSAAVLAPDATAIQAVLNFQLQQVTQQQLQAATTSSVNPSRILIRATSALSAARGNLIVTLSAVVGLGLLLLVAAAVGLTLSKRVLGPARWRQATATVPILRAIRLRRGSASQRRDTVRRVESAIRSVTRSNQSVVIAYLPSKKPELVRRSQFLTSALQMEGGLHPQVFDSFDDMMLSESRTLPKNAGPGPGRVPHPAVVLLVDLQECRVDDADALSRLDQMTAGSVLPILVGR